PSLQWFYRILQALALEEDLPEKAEDKTLPRWRQIHKRAGGYVVEWGAVLDEVFKAWQVSEGRNGVASGSGGGVKRSGKGDAGIGGPGAGGRGGAKKIKSEDRDDEEPVTDEQVRKNYEKNSLAKMTVADLKGWLSSKGLKTAGKKADLVDAVTGYFETKMEVD
ncbi:hypothetical protein KC352_g26582, partial [Hortaea werneckii]